MPLVIRSEEAEELATELVRLTGETTEGAITRALRELLGRLHGLGTKGFVADELDKIALHCAALPVLNQRGSDEIVSYDESGLPV